MTSSQGVLGIVISLLTVSKIWEEIRFMRSLRKELSALAGELRHSIRM